MMSGYADKRSGAPPSLFRHPLIVRIAMRGDESARLHYAVPWGLMTSTILRHPLCALWSIREPSARDSILLPVLAIPTLRARVERDIHRRAVALAPHMQGAPISSLLPRNLPFARGQGIADFIGDLLRKRRIRVNRPSAEIERLGIAREARKAGLRKRNFPPSEPLHGVEFGRLELDR